MQHRLFLAAALLMLACGLPAQTFDTLRYKEAYRKHFATSYYGPELTAEARIAGLSRAWAEAKFNFANFDLVPGLNWDSVYYAYLQQVIAAPTEADYYRTLMRFYGHLHDGHSLIIPPRALWNELNADLPIRTQRIEDRAVIVTNYSNDPAYAALTVGAVIERLDGLPVDDYINQFIAPYATFSTPQDSVAKIHAYFLTRGSAHRPLELTLRYPDGRGVTVSLVRKVDESMFPATEGFSYEQLDARTGLLRINTFNDPSVVAFYDSIFQQLPHPENLIIDLRRNGGGNGNNGFELIGYLTDQPFGMGKTVFRQYTPPYRAWGNDPDELEINQWDWNPHKGPTFRGKVAVLTGPSTYSAAEDFLVAFRAAGRGITIGQTTGGSTGQPLMFELPGGGMGIVCAKRDLFDDGTEFVGYGIRPDVEVNYTYANFVAGRDEAIDRALRYFVQ